jgi:hypothetical protein
MLPCQEYVGGGSHAYQAIRFLSTASVLALALALAPTQAEAQATVDPPAVPSECVENAGLQEFACGPGATTVGVGFQKAAVGPNA